MTHPHGSTSSATSTLPKGNIRSLAHIWSFLKPYWPGALGACFALIFTSSAVLGLGSALKYLINKGISEGNLALLDTYYWRLLIVVGVLALATYARYYLISWVGERVVADIRNAVYKKITAMHVGFFETTRTGELLSRITTDTTLLQTVVGSSVSIFLRNLLLFVGGTIMLVITSANLTQYVGFLLPLVIAPIIILGRRVRSLSRATQHRVADISAHAEETISAIRTIQAMALENVEQERFSGFVLKSRQTAVKRIRIRALLTAIVICLVFGAIVTVLWIGGRDVVSGAMTPGDLSAFIFYSVVVAGALGALSEVIGEMQRAAGATERLMELLELESEITAPDEPTELSNPVDGLICFNDITFHYPSRPDTSALEQFSLMTEPGKTIALVGPSGAGKTTVFQLLQRFYDPQQGTITLDGIDIRSLDPKTLRAAMAIVPQDPVIFSANAWDNIRCGRPNASDEDVKQAAKQANALSFIEALPKQFDTFLGEKGVRLSGGQKQRIAIARAIIRNPRILLLDEATSALDSENEKLVQEALHGLMAERTTLVIAHRLSTIQKADKIVVMENGQIDAVGTHDQLMKESALYARLANIQFQNNENQ